MTLHLEWMRFKRECLKGKGPAEVTAIKGVYYCGAAAAADAILTILEGEEAPEIKQRRYKAILTELRDFQRYTAKKAAEQAAEK